jgi:hypothetical protein
MKYPLSFSIRIFLKKLNFLLTNLAELVPSTNLDYIHCPWNTPEELFFP